MAFTGQIKITVKLFLVLASSRVVVWWLRGRRLNLQPSVQTHNRFLRFQPQ